MVSLDVLSSTFNAQNAEYRVRISPNFVKSNNTNEPMLGYRQWTLYTGIY